MDDTRRTVDRTHPLRELRKTPATGKSQVLQSSLRGRSQPSTGASEAGRRGGTSPDRDAEDMRALCAVCGKDMWPCRSNKIFCSRHCKNIDKRNVYAAARREDLAKRLCENCGKPVGQHWFRSGIRFCSTCAVSRPRPLRGVMTCPICGMGFRRWVKNQRTCSPMCGQTLRRQREKGEQQERTKPA